MVGAAMNRFSDWLWSMNGAAGRGQVDQRPLRQLPGGAEQLAGSRSGSAAMPCTEPSARLIASRTCGVHSPSAFSSATRCGVDLEELARTGSRA